MLEKRFAKLRSIAFNNKKKIVQGIKTHLYGREELMFAYIHGSFIREEAFRDIDIALYVRGSMNELFLEFGSLLWSIEKNRPSCGRQDHKCSTCSFSDGELDRDGVIQRFEFTFELF